MGYILIMFTHRGHARVVNCSLIYGRFLFKLAVNILQITKRSKGYVHVHAPCVVKHSIIFGRIVFKFDGHILQMTTSYMRYILIMFNHRVHASVRVRARE
jgi:hypothetical protein